MRTARVTAIYLGPVQKLTKIHIRRIRKTDFVFLHFPNQELCLIFYFLFGNRGVIYYKPKYVMMKMLEKGEGDEVLAVKKLASRRKI